MFSFPKPSVYQSAKCFLTYGQTPHLTPSHDPPTKGKPWTSVLAQDFVHRVDLVLPEECYEVLLQQKVLDELVPPAYFRVTMPLAAVLGGAFFLDYIKSGEALMISRGKEGIDSIFTIKDGKLSMSIDRETYERAGLVGQPQANKDRKNSPRWTVEYDLKSPSMLPGKKGFDRLLYACKNVFSTPVTWLVTTTSKRDNEIEPLLPFNPIALTAKPLVSAPLLTSTPSFTSLPSAFAACPPPELEEAASDLYEWLSLVRLSSPRVEASDSVDPYLSSYEIPQFSDGERAQKCALRRVTWRGFIPPSWTRTALAGVLAGASGKAWFSFSATSYSKGGMAGDGGECTFFRPPSSGGQYILFEIKA